jgi:hypothetical protein
MLGVKSNFSYTGVATQTPNTLTNTSVTHHTLSDLSSNNYPNSPADKSEPNANNQLVFMNQPMSWWLNSLQNASVKYTPISSYVNWSYVDSSGSVFHIGRPVSDLIIPNSIESTSRDSTTNTTTSVFKPKLGMNRTDTHTMNVNRNAGANN